MRPYTKRGAALKSSLETGDTTSFTKSPVDVPSGENETWEGWDVDENSIGLWQGNLTTSVVLDGRQVSESAPAGTSPSDGCWFSGSSFEPAALSGGWWNVGYSSQNSWGYDQVGWIGSAVNYYRRNAPSLPCEADVPQQMNILTGGQSGSSTSYFTDTIVWWISATETGSGKYGDFYSH